MRRDPHSLLGRALPQLMSIVHRRIAAANTDPLNTFKLKFINSILSRANEILEDNYKPFPEDFTLFDEDDMPNNSDVVFILSHYLTSLEKLRCDNIKYEKRKWYWVIDDKVSTQETEFPTIK